MGPRGSEQGDVASTVRRHLLTHHTAALEDVHYLTRHHYHGNMQWKIEGGSTRSS